MQISTTGCISVFGFFFFQAEDGIRDTSVTGVQTCALPISLQGSRWKPAFAHLDLLLIVGQGAQTRVSSGTLGARARGQEGEPGDSSFEFWSRGRSEERRVGKECRSRWSPDQQKQKEVEVAE